MSGGSPGLVAASSGPELWSDWLSDAEHQNLLLYADKVKDLCVCVWGQGKGSGSIIWISASVDWKPPETSEDKIWKRAKNEWMNQWMMELINQLINTEWMH